MVENCFNSFSRRILLHRSSNIYVLHILTNVILRLVIKTCKIHSAAWIPCTFYFRIFSFIKKRQPQVEVLQNSVHIADKHATTVFLCITHSVQLNYFIIIFTAFSSFKKLRLLTLSCSFCLQNICNSVTHLRSLPIHVPAPKRPVIVVTIIKYHY